MPEKKKLKLKKFFFHPITMFLVGTILVMLISLILSSFEMQSTYNSITTNGKDLTSKLVVVENLFNYENLKYLISNTVKNFMGFSPLCMLLISLIGISIAKATGLIDIISTKHIRKLSKYQLTYLVLLLGVISSIVNEVGYVILIPLAALVYEKNGCSPLFFSSSCSFRLSSAQRTALTTKAEKVQSCPRMASSTSSTIVTGNRTDLFTEIGILGILNLSIIHLAIHFI